MPGRCRTRFRREPGDHAAFLELNHTILAYRTFGQRHGKDITDRTYPLVRRCLPEVAVAVPLRLPRRVGNKIEDSLRGSGDHTARTDNPAQLRIIHNAIQTPTVTLRDSSGTMTTVIPVS